jgi:diguanylate cyclase (GGDEF)-like protein
MNPRLQSAIRAVLGSLTPDELDQKLLDMREDGALAGASESMAVILAVADAVREKLALSQELEALSRADSLTGLANRRVFDERLELELRRSARSRKSFALAFVDVDALARINDANGRAAGDRALCEVSEAIRRYARLVDFAARYNDDQIGVLLVDVDRSSAHTIAARLLEAIRLAGSRGEVPFTASAGVALSFPVDTADTIIERADAALHDAKQHGKNCVRFT